MKHTKTSHPLSLNCVDSVPSRIAPCRMLHSQKGFALILTLLVLTVLIILITQFTFTTKIDQLVALNNAADLQNHYALRAAVTYAKEVLMADKEDKDNKGDSLQDMWAEPFEDIEVGDVLVSFRLVDEASKLNVNSLVLNGKKKQIDLQRALVRLIENLDVKDTNAEEIVEELIAWIDEDDSGSFESDAKNGPLYTLRELMMLEGVTEDLFYGEYIEEEYRFGLVDLTTIWSEGNININTVGYDVLMSLSRAMQPAIADEIMDSAPFESTREILKVPGVNKQMFQEINKRLTVSSDIFSLDVIAKRGRMETRLWGILSRKDGKVVLLTWDTE